MNRLITFGCSHTYGVGLEDCQDTVIGGIKIPASKPSNKGWPRMVADALGLELVNMAWPAASNIEILYNILTFDFCESDTIVIMWSHYARDMVFDELIHTPLLRSRLAPWSSHEFTRKWIHQMTEEDFAAKTWMYIHHACLHLDNKNVKYIHYPAAPADLDVYPLPQLDIKNLYKEGINWVDKALDNSHPGPKSNAIIANNVVRILNGTK